MKKVLFLMLVSVIGLFASNNLTANNTYEFKQIGIMAYQEGEFSQQPTVSKITGYLVYINDKSYNCKKIIDVISRDKYYNYSCNLNSSVIDNQFINLSFVIHLSDNPTSKEIFTQIVDVLK